MSFIQLGSDQVISPVPAPTNGQVPVWNSSTSQYEAGTVSGGGSGWLLGGNSGTNPLTQFIGTTDAQPLVFRVNNSDVVRFDQTEIRSAVNDFVFTSTSGAKTLQPISVNNIDGLPLTIRGGATVSGEDLSPGGLTLSTGGGTGTLGLNNGIDFLAPIPTTSGSIVTNPVRLLSMRFTTANNGGEITMPATSGTSALIPGTQFTLQPAISGSANSGRSVTISGGSAGVGADLSPGGLVLSSGQGSGTLGTNPGISFQAQATAGSGTNVASLQTLARMRFTASNPAGELVFPTGGNCSIISGGNLDVSGATLTTIGSQSLDLTCRPTFGGSAVFSGNGTTGTTTIGNSGGDILMQPALASSVGRSTIVRGGNASGTNQAAGSLTLSSGTSTGNAGGDILISVPLPGTSGSTVNPLVSTWTLNRTTTYPGGNINYNISGASGLTTVGAFTIQSGGNLSILPTGNNSTSVSASGTGTTNLGTSGTGTVNVGKTTGTTNLSGFNKQTNMGYLEVFATANQTLTTGATTNIIFGTSNIANNITYATATGIVTFPRVGRYQVNVNIMVSGTRTADTTFGQMYMRVAGTVPRATGAMRTVGVASVQGGVTQNNSLAMNTSFVVNVTVANQTMNISIFNEGWNTATMNTSTDLLPCSMTVIELH